MYMYTQSCMYMYATVYMYLHVLSKQMVKNHLQICHCKENIHYEYKTDQFQSLHVHVAVTGRKRTLFHF